jgi:hypothetical protein
MKNKRRIDWIGNSVGMTVLVITLIVLFLYLRR